MSRAIRVTALSVLIMFGLTITGCSSQQAYEAELSQLSEHDRALAESQGLVCPVSDKPLGSMGVPYKVIVNGQEVILCCQKGEEKMMANPEKYLAKLPREARQLGTQ